MEVFEPRKRKNFDDESIKQLYKIEKNQLEKLRKKDIIFLKWIISDTIKLKGNNHLVSYSLNLVSINKIEFSIDILMSIYNFKTETKGIYLKRLYFQNGSK